MIGTLFRKIIGTRNDRELKRIRKIVNQVNDLEADFQALDDNQLKAKTDEFRSRLADGSSLDQLLPEAFAAVREAAGRTLNMRHFDVQIIGGVVLHEGKIAEMSTGEGKTLVATLAVYLNALSGKGVHIVTVNDYLAKRDAEWMSPVYEALGMTVGVIHSGQEPQKKRDAYKTDITYGTNNEFGFDYLRDNMAFRLEDKTQRELNFAIVDEVDSILIDEARTPLIISGAVQDSSMLYKRINALIPRLQQQVEEEVDGEIKVAKEGDFVIDEKMRQADLTENGHKKVEQLLIKDGLLKADDSLYAATNLNLLHHVHTGLRAHTLFNKDVDWHQQPSRIISGCITSCPE
jgi:preprotein translocase subunit SecA